jgi:hypothetical protein
VVGSLIAIGLLVIFHCQYCYGSAHLDKWTGVKINYNHR